MLRSYPLLLSNLAEIQGNPTMKSLMPGRDRAANGLRVLAAFGTLILGACGGTTYLKTEVTVAKAGDRSYITKCKPEPIGGRNMLSCQISEVTDQDEESVTAVFAEGRTFGVGLEESSRSVKAQTDQMGVFLVDVITKLDPEPFFKSDKEDLCVKVSGTCIARVSRAWFAKTARARIMAKVDAVIQTGSKQCLDWIDSHPGLFKELQRANAHTKLVTCAEEELLRLVLDTQGQESLDAAEKNIARLEALKSESNRLPQMRSFIAPMKRRAKEAVAKSLVERTSKLIDDGNAEGAINLAQECVDLKPSIVTTCVELRERAVSQKNLRLAFALEKQAADALKAKEPQAALQAAAQCYEYDRTNKECRKLAITASAALEKLNKKKAAGLIAAARQALKKNEQESAKESIAACLGIAPYHKGCLAMEKAYNKKYSIQESGKEVWGGLRFGLSPTDVVKNAKVGKLFVSKDNNTYKPGDEVPKRVAELAACASHPGSDIKRPMSCVRTYFKNGGLVRIDVGYESYAKKKIAKKQIAEMRNKYAKPHKTQREDFTPVEYHPDTYVIVTWMDPSATIELVCHEEEFLQAWSLRFYSAEAE